MKKLIAISVIVLLFSVINYSFIIESSSSASIAMPVQLRSFFSINSIEVTEGDNPQAIFTVSLTYDGGVREFASSINYATVNGTATSGSDYQQSSGTVNFPPGATPGGTVSMTVSIPIVDDSETEGDEAFTVILNNASPAFEIQGPGTCTIHDNDSGPSGLVILDAQVVEGDSGITDAVFRVGLNGASSSAVSVDFATENLSAVAGADYLSRTGTLTISVGQRSGNITVPIVGDTLPELTQSFFVRLSNARGASITDGEAVGVIIDNDNPQTINVCSGDTPKEGFIADEIKSKIRIDRDMLADDLEVSLFLAPPFFSPVQISHLDITKSDNSTSSASERYRLIDSGISQVRNEPQVIISPALGGLGTTCSTSPNCVFTSDAQIPFINGEPPYVGRWFIPYRFPEGINTKGEWEIAISSLSLPDNPAANGPRLQCWCLNAVGPREGLRLDPARTSIPIILLAALDRGEIHTGINQYRVRASLNASGGPAAWVPVTFEVRDKGRQGEIILTDEVFTDDLGQARFEYANWVPGEHTIEARAKVNGATYTDIATVVWTNPCAATAALQGAADAEITLNEMRNFRDSKLDQSMRGREYSRLYYKFSAEAIRLMMFNPMMAVRSQGMIERYMPVIRDLSAGRSALLTEGDLKEIDTFISDFAAGGSEELQQTVEKLRRDLRDPEVYRDLGITIRPGVRREMPTHNQIQSLRQVRKWTTLLGFLLGGVLLIRLRRRKSVRIFLCLMLALSIPSIASGNLSLAIAAMQGQSESQMHEYSSYFGGSGNDQGTSVTADAEGNLYIVGITNSTNLPTMNAAQPGFGGGAQDAFVAKFDPSGTRLIYLTYLGGSSNETATSIAVDTAGNAYITGFTTSTNFPTVNALQQTNRGRFNGFVTKLAPTGNLVYSTYLGGSANDSGSGIAVDSSGNLYIAGIATSPDFPTVNPLQPNLSGASDVYIAKLNAAGNQLLYSTFLGGSQEDAATGISVDPSGNVYVTGATLSTDFRIANAVQSAHGGGIFDAFVMKLNPSGNSLIYSTYLGGGNGDRGMRISTDAAGNAYVTGDTRSTNFPIRGSVQQTLGGSSDAFITKLTANGSLAYSTYLGGSGIDGGTSVSVDSAGNAFVTGYTDSANFPLAAPLQTEFKGGSFDAFVARIDASGSSLEQATYFGGSGLDSGFAVATVGASRAILIGLTDSVDLPTSNPFQMNNGGGTADLFIAKISSGPLITAVSVKGANLIITGKGFEGGAVILVNGQQQKTKFQSAISLKGKKSARKIEPGQIVQLQVRNPDGSLSQEFTYTR